MIIDLAQYREARAQLAVLKCEMRLAWLGHCLKQCDISTARAATERFERAVAEMGERVA